MPRPKGSGKFGPVRSLRLPLELDEWFERRLRDDATRSASDILLEAVHGGLRLQPGYMWRQRLTLTSLLVAGERAGYESYVRGLADTFGSAYVEHLEAWLRADSHPFRLGGRRIDAVVEVIVAHLRREGTECDGRLFMGNPRVLPIGI